MTCSELTERIEQLQPAAMPRDVARLCLLLTNHVDNLEDLEDDEFLIHTWRTLGIRLQSATDQHAAMTAELESLADQNPRDLTADQIRVLVRAIKVQSQVLQLYVGHGRIEV